MIPESKFKRRLAGASRRVARRAAAWLRSQGASGGTMRALVALAAPIATAMAGETVMGLVDTKLVGGLGPAALGGVGVAMTLAFLGYMTIFGLMRGVKVCVAHAVGQGFAYRSVRYAQAGIALGIVTGIVVWAMTRNVAPVLRAIGIDGALVPYAVTFLSTYTYAAPASAVVSALTQHRQALGDSRTPMIVGLAGNVANAALGWSLIYGHLGLLAMGVRGGAIATATAEYFEAILLTALLISQTRRAHYARAQSELPLRQTLREVTQLGIPTGVQFGSEMLAFVTFTALLGTLGTEQIAAHQIALATIRTSFLPGTAVSEAASVLVGQALGRRSLADADRTTRAALILAVGFMASCGLAFLVAAGAIVRAFTDDPIVARVARHLLWIAAGFQVLDAVSIVLRGALRGARDVRVPAAIGVAVVWTCVPTAALVLGRVAGWGAVGGWCGFVGETSIGALLFATRWRHGPWRRVYGAGTKIPTQSEFRTTSELALRAES